MWHIIHYVCFVSICLSTTTDGIGYEEALLQFAYRKLLMMVIFLDKAKMERLMDNDPCLFVKTANVKVK